MPGLYADCQAHPLQLELSYNLYFDPGFPVFYNRVVGIEPSLGLGPYVLELNMVGNRMVVRSGHDYPLLHRDFIDTAENTLFVSGNTMSAFPTFADYELAHCCNGFIDAAPNMDFGTATRRTERHPFPAVTATTGDTLAASIISHAGAAPRDPMDRRIFTRVATGTPQLLPHTQAEADDAFDTDYDPASPPAAPADSDGDGMPDSFEHQHVALGLDPGVADHDGTSLSLPLTGVAGYTNIEVYLDLLADALVAADRDVVFADGFEP